MDKQAAYELGVRLALEDAGLVKESAMDPGIRKGVQQRRSSATAEGNRYAGGWSPNVPKTPSEKIMATSKSGVGGPPKLPPIDHSAEAGKKFKGVS